MNAMRLAGALLLTGLAAACSGEANGGPEPSVRDSAGVRIVENAKVPAPVWRVGTEPQFTVGWDENGPMFTWAQSGRILSDGGALVGEFGEGMIYRIGPDGSVVETRGRKGEGPGEYQALDAILLRGDSILVSDNRLRRLTFLSPDGEVRTTQLPGGTFLHQASAILTDGRLLLVPGEGYSAVAEMRPEWVFETQPILAADLESGTVDTLAELPHLRRWYGTRGASPGPVQVKGRAGGFADGFAWARSDEREVRWYDGSGRLVQVARWDEEPVPATREWRDHMVRTFEEAYNSRGVEESVVAARLVQLEEELDRHEGPVPYWGWFRVDRLGNAWLSQYTLPGKPPGAWRVFARDGSFMGWVDLPEVVNILDITNERILAVRWDDDDVPAVVMLGLIKS